MTLNNKHMPLSKVISRLVLYIVVFNICMLILYPYFVMFCTALKSRAEIFAVDGTILPINALWSNFVDIWKMAPMGSYMLNSIKVAGGSTLIAMLCGIPAAYALARMEFKGQTAFLGLIIVSQMFAPVVLLIGIYKVIPPTKNWATSASPAADSRSLSTAICPQNWQNAEKPTARWTSLPAAPRSMLSAASSSNA